MSAETEPARVLLRPPAVRAGLVGPAPLILFIRRLGLVVVMLVVVAARGAPWIAAYDPTEQDITNRLRPPGSPHAAGRANLLGTDHLGRDILARVLFGARPALMVGF